QREILEAAQNYVKLHGILLYSTCTVSKKENEDNVKWFCEKFGFELMDISSYIKDVFEAESVKSIQILPDMMGTDGFFIAKMRRKPK
ncbi:MAG: 16S rRNA (cytosine(967)-C(5))-methyltransferase, partial [Firmicutes bacterium]|nr:16S rRNA (cytosine(967)-C(5))-methyltransferase [Bacillota bacterium]